MRSIGRSYNFTVSPQGLAALRDRLDEERDFVKHSNQPGRALVFDALLELSAAAQFGSELLQCEPDPENDEALSRRDEGRTINQAGEAVCAFCGKSTPHVLSQNPRLCCWSCGSVFPEVKES